MVIYLKSKEEREFFHIYFGRPPHKGRAVRSDLTLLHNTAGKLFDTTGCTDEDVGGVLMHEFLDCENESKTSADSPKPMSTNFR